MLSYISAPLVLALCFLALFGFAEFLYHRQRVKPEITRKIVHVGTGLLTLLFPVFLHNQWQVLFLCASFLLILLGSLQFKLLPSINRIDRVSHGSILYPVAVCGCYVAYSYANEGLFFFYLPILTLAICDPIAALIGKRNPFGRYQIGASKKTLSGSLAFFTSSVCVSLFCLYFFRNHQFSFPTVLPIVFLIATTTTAVEAVSAKGTDNIFIPGVVLLNLTLVI